MENVKLHIGHFLNYLKINMNAPKSKLACKILADPIASQQLTKAVFDKTQPITIDGKIYYLKDAPSYYSIIDKK